jgi:hypothetical protein
MDFDFLGDREEEWKSVSLPALIAWLVFYALFLVYAFAAHGEYLFIDNVNLVVHEGGHLFFGWFGQTIGIAGGTLMQLLVPLALTAYFAFYRQSSAVAFTAFFFFENFLDIAPYMADARRQELQLVTVGDAENTIHDWFYLFSKLGVLEHDTAIAAVVRALGWLGMLACVGWLVIRARAGWARAVPERK